MVTLADNSPIAKARTFEKVVNRRAHLRLRPIPAETRAQLDDAPGLTDLWVRNCVRLTNLNRWYDAKVGRWVSEDPVGFAAGDANIYQYEFNQATSRTDPSGLGGGTFWSDYWHYLTHPWDMDDDLETGFYVAAGTAVVAGGAAAGIAIAGGGGAAAGGAAGGGAAASGTAAAGYGVGSQAVVAPGLGGGSYAGLGINGTVYCARFHDVAWKLANYAEPIEKYGIVTIDAAGKVIGWL